MDEHLILRNRLKTVRKEKNYHRDSGEAMQNDRNRWEQYRGGVHPFFDHADKLSRGIPQNESHTAGI